jgi:hypothetical protein
LPQERAPHDADHGGLEPFITPDDLPNWLRRLAKSPVDQPRSEIGPPGGVQEPAEFVSLATTSDAQDSAQSAEAGADADTEIRAAPLALLPVQRNERTTAIEAIIATEAESQRRDPSDTVSGPAARELAIAGLAILAIALLFTLYLLATS